MWFVYEILDCCWLPVIASCVGYPVLRNKVDFKRTDKAANKEDLNRIVTATKVSESYVLVYLLFAPCNNVSAERLCRSWQLENRLDPFPGWLA